MIKSETGFSPVFFLAQEKNQAAKSNIPHSDWIRGYIQLDICNKLTTNGHATSFKFLF
jgi:hypothetical protein